MSATTTPLVLITVDTEEEWDWNGPLPRDPFSTRNIDELHEFQDFCRSLHVVPTYFVDHAVVERQAHVELFRHYLRRGECDVGAHLHPWCTPPITEVVCDRNSHAVNLPLELFAAKVATLTDALTTAFEQHPCSFRAGRWGINGAQLEILARAGYQVDSTVRPFYSDRYFTYDAAPTSPYWPSFRDCLVHDPDQRAILEIPVSSGFNRRNFEVCQTLYRWLSASPMNRLRLVGILARLGILRKTTATPEGERSADICRCIDRCIERGEPVINLFFHSSDLLPGCTPYVRTRADKLRFMDCLRTCIQHLQDTYDARSTTMRQIRSILTEGK